MSIRNLDRLLDPAAVAVIGASARPATVGATVWRNLRASSFRGPVYAVNPKHAELDGAVSYPSVDALPAGVDLAVVCTPAAAVADVIGALGRHGVRAAIVMTAGLSAAQRQAMLDAARPHTLRVLGPNCLGLLAPHIGLNASFAHTDALPGDVAFVSQSGALVTAVLDWAKARGVGFSQMISLGEHADVDFGDLLDHLASDPRTRSILLYIESISATRKFMSAARAAARNKPVIVVKAGRAGRGPAAAASHTGALAGSDLVFDAAIRRAGMLRVDTLQQLFVAAETLARLGANRDDVLSLMTNGGGAGVMAADAAALAGVELAPLAPALIERLDAALPPTWSRANPVDIIGDAPVERYVETLRALLAERGSGAVLFVHAPTAIVRSEDIARACAPIVREARGRVLACWLGQESVAQARRIFETAGAADYDTPEEAVRAFAMLATYRRNQTALGEVPSASECAPPDVPAARAQIDAALAQGREWLDDEAAIRVLRAYGIPVVATRRAAADADAAVAAANEVGYALALKVRSAQIQHKSDVGGVQLGIGDARQLRDACRAMLARVREKAPHAQLDGFTLQAMASRPGSTELIVGASVDPVFGPVILFGHGGTAVEVLADRAIALPPLNRALAGELVGRTRVARLLAGYRDRPPADRDALHDVLIAVSQMLADLPQIVELDINPLCADERGVLALDARIRIAASRPGGAANFAIAPYPAALARTLPWNGDTLELRPIRPEDGPMHAAFVAALAPQDLRFRFFSVRRELAASELARLTQIDYAREMAFIAVRRRADGGAETLGVARAVSDPDNVEAEFGIVVRSDLKGGGFGTLLMNALIDYQAARGTQRLVGLVLRDNRPMRQLALHLGFDADEAGSDADALRFVLPLQPRPATPAGGAPHGA